MNLDATLLEILVCPACRATLSVDDDASELVCNGCGLAYPVHDDIPVMLIDEARRPDPAPEAPLGDGSAQTG
ncbi:Trm112 family protein [soil metagenome]